MMTIVFCGYDGGGRRRHVVVVVVVDDDDDLCRITSALIPIIQSTVESELQTY